MRRSVLSAISLIDKYANLAACQIAEAYALRNDAKATFEWLDRAWRNRDPGIGNLLIDLLILRYKDDSRFAAFCRRVGLPVPGRRPRASRPDPVLPQTSASPNMDVSFPVCATFRCGSEGDT